MSLKVTETTKWTIQAQIEPDRHTAQEGMEFVSVSAAEAGKLRMAVDDGTGEVAHTYLGPKGSAPIITVKVEWKDKADGDVEEEEEAVRRPAKDWFGVEEG